MNNRVLISMFSPLKAEQGRKYHAGFAESAELKRLHVEHLQFVWVHFKTSGQQRTLCQKRGAP